LNLVKTATRFQRFAGKHRTLPRTKMIHSIIVDDMSFNAMASIWARFAWGQKHCQLYLHIATCLVLSCFVCQQRCSADAAHVDWLRNIWASGAGCWQREWICLDYHRKKPSRLNTLRQKWTCRSMQMQESFHYRWPSDLRARSWNDDDPPPFPFISLPCYLGLFTGQYGRPPTIRAIQRRTVVECSRNTKRQLLTEREGFPFSDVHIMYEAVEFHSRIKKIITQTLTRTWSRHQEKKSMHARVWTCLSTLKWTTYVSPTFSHKEKTTTLILKSEQ
jgi:hypothetical protein